VTRISSHDDAGEVRSGLGYCHGSCAPPSPIQPPLWMVPHAHERRGARLCRRHLISRQASRAVPGLFREDDHIGPPRLADGGRGRHGPCHSRRARRQTAPMLLRPVRARSNCLRSNSLPYSFSCRNSPLCTIPGHIGVIENMPYHRLSMTALSKAGTSPRP
jgi:hypothetical protein